MYNYFYRCITDVETFKDCMESQQSETETLQAAFDNQTIKINDLTNQNSQLEVLTNEKEQLQLAFDELNYEKQSLVETNESLQQQINDLNEKLSSLRAEYDNKLNQGKIIIEELSTAHDKIMLLESLQDVKQHKDGELKLLRDQLVEKDELLTNIQHQKVTLEEEISLVKSDLTEKENIINDLREEVHGFQSVYDTERSKYLDIVYIYLCPSPGTTCIMTNLLFLIDSIKKKLKKIRTVGGENFV